jgi:hypothetical protein
MHSSRHRVGTPCDRAVVRTDARFAIPPNLTALVETYAGKVPAPVRFRAPPGRLLCVADIDRIATRGRGGCVNAVTCDRNMSRAGGNLNAVSARAGHIDGRFQSRHRTFRVRQHNDFIASSQQALLPRHRPPWPAAHGWARSGTRIGWSRGTKEVAAERNLSGR